MSPRERAKVHRQKLAAERLAAEMEAARSDVRTAVFAEAEQVDPELPPPPPPPDTFLAWLQTPEGQSASDPRLPTDRIGLEIALEDALRKAFNAGLSAGIHAAIL